MRKDFYPLLVLIGAMFMPSYARAYDWPIEPFGKPHIIQGNFMDPRMSKRFFDEDPRNKRSYHSGIDIAAPAGTPVYSIYPGTARLIEGTALSIWTSENLRFEYWHIRPIVHDGEWIRYHQLVGWVAPRRGGGEHVHLSEWRNPPGDYVNPRRSGGIYPDPDFNPPVVKSLSFIHSFRASFYRFSHKLPQRYEMRDSGRWTPKVSGKVSIWSNIYDKPSLQPLLPWNHIRLSPTMVTWWLKTRKGRIVLRPKTAVDFRFEFSKTPITDTYAPGTLQNGPRQAGRYNIWLSRDLNTTEIPDGIYIVVVQASDTAGNRVRRGFPIQIKNRSHLATRDLGMS